MISRIVQWLVGYVEFSFSGGFGADFLNECFQLGLNVYKIRGDSRLTARCPVHISICIGLRSVTVAR